MSGNSPSLLGRAIVALLLLIGFYLLAIVIAGILFYIPYAEWTYAGRLHLKLALFCVICGIVILLAIVPRPDRFTAPGPRLLPEQNPRLFENLLDVARKTDQRMPAEVYLIPDVNAWVSQRGGLMGLGSRRVMGLGLPLMQILSVAEFRAVLAHEFGHFYGGDTKLGPWIYKTRSAIERTLEGLAGSWLQKPFIIYGNMFLRVTHAISRRQETIADELAAATEGSRHLASGLRKIYAASLAYESYWDNELAPALESGFLPPYAKGFQLFIEAGPIKESITSALTKELETTETNPYQTHPPLRERLKALEALTAEPDVTGQPSAITLLGDLVMWENALFKPLESNLGKKLEPVNWENLGKPVYLPRWEKALEKHQPDLSGLTFGSLPESSESWEELSGKLAATAERAFNSEEKTEYLAYILGAALTISLVKTGWSPDVNPGLAVTVHSGSKSLESFHITRQLVLGELKSEDWQKTCDSNGISGLKLV